MFHLTRRGLIAIAIVVLAVTVSTVPSTVARADGYITSCTLTASSPAVPLDDTIITVTASSPDSGGALAQFAADGGPATVMGWVGFNTDSFILSEFDRAELDTAFPGAQSMSFLLTGADDEVLCSLTLPITTRPMPSFVTPAALPPVTVGVPYSIDFAYDDNGTTVTGCAVEGTPALSGTLSLTVNEGTRCPSLAGVATEPGTYVLTLAVTYSDPAPVFDPTRAGPHAASSPALAAVTRTFTLVVNPVEIPQPVPVAAPTFTG